MKPNISIREHVRANPRPFCCGGPEPCIDPAYPKSKDELGCKSFRCSRCKATVGWCCGAAYEAGHPANGWCDSCYVEIYMEPAERAKKALHRFREVASVIDGDGVKPTVEITVQRRGSQPYHIVNKTIIRAVREAGVVCSVLINGKVITNEGEPVQ